MEVLNDEKTVEATAKGPLGNSAHLFAGILMVVCGLVWLMSNYHLVSPAFMDAFFSWQMLIVAVGGWLLCARQWCAGGVVTAVGVVLLLFDVLNIYISFERLVLPLLVVAGGVACVVKALKK